MVGVFHLQVNNEVPIGFLEVSVLQKGLGGGGSGPASVPKKGAKVSAAGAKPVTLFTFSMEAEEPSGSGMGNPCLTTKIYSAGLADASPVHV